MDIIHPNEAAGRFNAEQGLYYLHSGNTILAHEKFVLAQNQAPTDPLTLDALAFYYEKTGDLELANDTFTHCCKIQTPEQFEIITGPSCAGIIIPATLSFIF
jgi:Tfp pilus assembly protein PilF